MRDEISDAQIDALHETAQVVKSHAGEYDHDDVDLLEAVHDSGMRPQDYYEALSDDEREAVDSVLDSLDGQGW